MTDLHAWITQQVDCVEAAALAEVGGRCVIVQTHDGSHAIAGVVTEAAAVSGGMQLSVAQYDVEPRDGTLTPIQSVATVLRRCEADRRILARHRLATEWTWQRDPACHGCGTSGDCDDPVTDNVNDCSELLDLAHAHGLTDEILAGLDRPQPPEPSRAQKRRLRERARLTVPITTSEVPEALRGTRRKP